MLPLSHVSHTRYDDCVGPTVLAIALLAVMIASLVFVWVDATGSTTGYRRRSVDDTVAMPTLRDHTKANRAMCAHIPPCDGIGWGDPLTAESQQRVSGHVLVMGWNTRCFATHTKRALSSRQILGMLAQLANPFSTLYGCADFNATVAASSLSAGEHSVGVVTRVCSSVDCIVDIESADSSAAYRVNADPVVEGNSLQSGVVFGRHECNSVSPRSLFTFPSSVPPKTRAAMLLGPLDSIVTEEVAFLSTYSHAVTVGGVDAWVRIRCTYRTPADREAGANPTTAEINIELPPALGVADFHHAAFALRLLRLASSQSMC